MRHSLRELDINVKTLGFRRLTSKIMMQFEEINPDFVFNLCETLYTHKHKAMTEMYVTGWLELMKVPYTGAPPLSVALALNKMRTKQLLRGAGLPVPPSILARIGEKPNFESITPPFIVKPVREDGSFGITKHSVVKSIDEAEEQVVSIHQNYQQAALVEEFIEGREFTAALADDPPRVLGIGEADFSALGPKEPKIISYEAKWSKESSVKVSFPAEIEITLAHRLEKISLKAFELFGCRDYARIDFRVSENRRPYILEVNPNPDLSPDEEFGGALKAVNVTYTDFIKSIVGSTLARGTRVDFE